MDPADRADIFSSPDEPLAETAVSVLQKIQQRHAKMPVKKTSNLAEEAQEDLILLSDTSGSTGTSGSAPRWCRHKRTGKASDTTQGAEIAPKVYSDTVDTAATVGSFGLSKETDMLALELCAQAELRLIWEDCKLDQQKESRANRAATFETQTVGRVLGLELEASDFRDWGVAQLAAKTLRENGACLLRCLRQRHRTSRSKWQLSCSLNAFCEEFLEFISGPRLKSREVEDNFERTRHEAGVRSEFLEHTKLGFMMGFSCEGLTIDF